MSGETRVALDAEADMGDDACMPTDTSERGLESLILRA